MKTTKYILTLVLAFWSAMGNLYAVEKSYYNSIDGKSGTALREALTTLTYTKHTTDVGYNWTFDGIDIVNGEKVCSTRNLHKLVIVIISSWPTER